MSNPDLHQTKAEFARMSAVDELAAIMLAACIENPPGWNFINYIQARAELSWPVIKLVQEPAEST